MIDIDKFHTFFYLIANKNGIGTVTPSQFNSIVERALFAWTNKQISNQKEYQPGNPMPRTSLDLDQASIDRLKHLKETHTVSCLGGEMPIPNGVTKDINGVIMPEYWTLSRLTHKYQSNGKIVTQPISIVKDNEWAINLSSSIVAPTKKRAIANIQSDNFLIEPSSLINLVTLVYLRVPNTPVWGYNLTNNRPVYDSSKSQSIDAPKQAFNEIAMIALELIGIVIREPELVQAASGLENTGV